MPELPEVETMVRGLRPALAGRTLSRHRDQGPDPAPGLHGRGVRAAGRGATVVGVVRRGKWVVIELADDRGIIVIQPRMTGGFWLVEPRATRTHPPGVPCGQTSSDRLVLRHTATGQGLLVSPAPRRRPRPSRDRTAPTRWRSAATSWPRRLARTARGIKPTLMDQKVLAGIGNIYADEVLHRAGIHPERTGLGALAGGDRPAARGDRRGPGDGDRAWRAPASTPATARSSASRAAFWPRIPSTAAETSPAGRAKDRSSRPRSPD